MTGIIEDTRSIAAGRSLMNCLRTGSLVGSPWLLGYGGKGSKSHGAKRKGLLMLHDDS